MQLPKSIKLGHFEIFIKELDPEIAAASSEEGSFLPTSRTIWIDKSIIEAAYDNGANGLQILWNIIIPLCKPGIVIGSIFVITVVMGDFITIGIMGGQQIPSIGKIIYVEMSYLQLPAAAANAVILLALTLLIIWIMTKMIDIRKEL